MGGEKVVRKTGQARTEAGLDRIGGGAAEMERSGRVPGTVTTPDFMASQITAAN